MVTSRPRFAIAALVGALAVSLWGPFASPLSLVGADDELSVPAAEAAYESAQAATDAATARLDELEEARSDLADRLDQRDGRRRRALADLRSARTQARELAVAAYMGSGDREVDVLDDVAGATEYLYRETLLRDSSAARSRAAAYFQGLRTQADEAVTQTLAEIDDLDARITQAQIDAYAAADREREAGVQLREAEQRAEARRRAAAEAAEAARAQAEATAVARSQGASGGGNVTAGSPSGPWQPIGTLPGGPSPGQWAALRNCESSGNYQAVNPSGKYRGAYQFDLATWQTVGGSGDPAAASPAEQDHRAQLLYAQRGHSPWPICGRFLI